MSLTDVKRLGRSLFATVKSSVMSAPSLADLQAINIPTSEDPCRSCSNPCEDGHTKFPERFDVDRESEMLGSVKPYHRQVVISTGKSDWPREVTDVQGTLAAYLSHVHSSQSNGGGGKGRKSGVAGIFSSGDSTRLGVLNGSHFTVSDDHSKETVLVLPDYKLVTEVETSEKGAKLLYESVLAPSLGRAGVQKNDSPIKTWILPYSCLILLCSHKRRDRRCHISAPILEQTFAHSLEKAGWTAHTKLEDVPHSGVALEEIEGSEEAREAEVLRRLKEVSTENSALILRNSHIGGHRYAGNCIIYTPQGAGVWYGRVSPHEVDAIVEHTIIGGKVLPPLLRGGVNIAKAGCKSLHDW